MDREADNRHYVRRVVLPSGKTIEVVYFDEIPAFPAVGDSGYTESGEDLHVCGSCGSDLVFPVEWDEAGATHWEVTLRCPNCEWNGTGTFSQDVVERFVYALEADHILPDDF